MMKWPIGPVAASLLALAINSITTARDNALRGLANIQYLIASSGAPIADNPPNIFVITGEGKDLDFRLAFDDGGSPRNIVMTAEPGRYRLTGYQATLRKGTPPRA